MSNDDKDNNNAADNNNIVDNNNEIDRLTKGTDTENPTFGNLVIEEQAPKNKFSHDLISRIIPFIPLSIPVLTIGISIITYIQAVYYGHVEPIFPYVSDAAATPPEAAYFTQVLNIIAVLVLMTIWWRFQQVKSVYRRYSNDDNNNPQTSLPQDSIELILTLNKLSLLLALLTSLGISIAGCFRDTEMLWIHLTSATLIFTFAPILVLLQTWMSMLMIPHLSGRRLAIIKIMLTAAVFVSLLLMDIFAIWSIVLFEKDVTSTDRLLWSANNQGYFVHVLSAIFEWLTLTLMVLYIACFYVEMRLIHLVNGEFRYDVLKSLDAPATPIGNRIVGPKSLGRLLLWVSKLI